MLWTDRDRFGRITDYWRDFDRINRALWNLSTPTRTDFPAVNVWANGDHAVVTAEIPGIAAEAVDISVVGRSLTLKGTRERDGAAEGDTFHRRERRYGPFSRTIELPFLIDANNVKARIEKGVLSVTLPRAEADKPKKITIQTAHEKEA